MSTGSLLLVVLAGALLGPAQAGPSVDHDPLKFSLDRSEPEPATTPQQPFGDRLNSRIHDGMELRSETRNNVAGAIGAASDIIERGRGSREQQPATRTSGKGRESAKLESESEQGLLERRSNGPLSSLIESIVKPTPIVDGLDERDKYGNSGDRFIGVGRALVSGFEGIGNILNAIAEFPVKAAKQTSRNLTEALNQIGARIVGLQ